MNQQAELTDTFCSDGDQIRCQMFLLYCYLGYFNEFVARNHRRNVDFFPDFKPERNHHTRVVPLFLSGASSASVKYATAISRAFFLGLSSFITVPSSSTLVDIQRDPL